MKGQDFDIYPIKIRPCTTDDDISIQSDAQYDIWITQRKIIGIGNGLKMILKPTKNGVGYKP